MAPPLKRSVPSHLHQAGEAQMRMVRFHISGPEHKREQRGPVTTKRATRRSSDKECSGTDRSSHPKMKIQSLFIYVLPKPVQDEEMQRLL